MEREQKIIDLIENRVESEYVDFKQEFYHKDKTQDLIKDVLSFANAFSNDEKYIIFGADENDNLFDVDCEKVRDISEINQILNEYCEPFIKVENYCFTYKGKNLLALIISGNFDRPYLIKKDYQKNGFVWLRTGEIYIRKGATNFKASRDDLDCIYANRETIQLTVKDNSLQFKNLRHGHKKELVCCIPILVDNNSNKSIIINNGTVNWQYYNTSSGSHVNYIEDGEESYIKELKNINDKPFLIQAHMQYQKSLILKVSTGLIEIIEKKMKENEKLKISIKLFDAMAKEIVLDTLIDSIKFDLD